jgi:hypothetical protein
MKPTAHFSATAETAAGRGAARAWFEANPEHPGNAAAAKLDRGLSFADCSPECLAKALGTEQPSGRGAVGW